MSQWLWNLPKRGSSWKTSSHDFEEKGRGEKRITSYPKHCTPSKYDLLLSPIPLFMYMW
jgi:hypothetical protein